MHQITVWFRDGRQVPVASRTVEHAAAMALHAEKQLDVYLVMTDDSEVQAEIDRIRAEMLAVGWRS